MKKYIPTEDDLYSTRPCAICGADVIEYGEDTCSDDCEMHWQIFKEDLDDMMMEEI